MHGEFLFVYGTLLKDVGHPMAAYLARRAWLMGPAKAPGRLYDLGPYPGLVEAGDQNEWVHGELYELLDSTTTLAVLDDYESLGSVPPLFVRKPIQVLLGSGETRTAWVYLYGGPMKHARHIASGDYRPSRIDQS